MKKVLFSAIIGICTCLGFANLYHRTQETLTDDWKFKFADVHKGESSKLDDSDWERVRVPHDWAIDKHFDMNIDIQKVMVLADGEKTYNLRTGRTGALPCFGIGWYRKNITLPQSENSKRVFLEFDGAMSRAKIFLNGKFMGEWPYGYASFCVDITPEFKFGEDNVLAVKLDNKDNSSRWYSGAGLFRNVRLVAKSPIHVDYNGTYITTPQITDESATCKIVTSLNNFAKDKSQAVVSTEIFAPDGKMVAQESSNVKFDGDFKDITQSLEVKTPKLWDLDSPNLYKAVTKVLVDGKVCDVYETPFGIRSIDYSRENGFRLNGKKVVFKGVCMHHDLGPIGAAVNRRATERQIEIMKEMGCNAFRTSHNPPSPELLELCDKMGILVMDEAFDEWKEIKCENGYNKFFDKWAEKDLVNFVKRDRNHPSIVIWSIGNEVYEQRGEAGGKRAKWLADIVRREDATRPVTAGMNWHWEAVKNGFADALDLAGFNYKPHDYKSYFEKYPNMIVYGSETASTLSSRGEYFFPVKEWNKPWRNEYQTSSYDLECAPWSQVPDTEWEKLDDFPQALGEFVWTGFDYLGEPYPYQSGGIARSAYFGIVDLGGLKKDRFYLYQARWKPEAKTLHVLPHWNWEDKIGQNIPVYVYTSYPKAELFVNGKSMGIREKSKKSKFERYRLMWNDVVYQPGELKVVALDQEGKPQAEKILKTAGAPAKLKLIPDRTTILPDRKDLCFVEVQMLDKDGNICPRANNIVFIHIEGNGKLKALCNGDATETMPFSSNYMRLYNGKMIAVIESPSGNSGDFEVIATSERVKKGSTKIRVSE